ncbi:ribonuclease P protein component [Gordonia sp. PS3]|uniref:ribonuclease P protein component n=1 Tax=unclassified Gordonia (in: high G+C Gram-positive bacteria) TaxID=2657482 RepID=UPI000782C474|nr:ribonuclease P protein component [Gordonia sp. QH-12]KXT56988.1 ribonuclease P [Gordonia sp. QH-12]
MSADSARISRKSDFTRTLSKGVRVSARDLTVHVAPVAPAWPDGSRLRPDVALHGGPWLGLIISKKVGNAVIRHRTARRLRRAFAESAPSVLPPETFVVLRAHPGIVDRSSSELAETLRGAFAHRKVAAACARADRGTVVP